MFKYIKNNFLYVLAGLFLLILTASQTYILLDKWETHQEKIMQEIDKNRDVTSYIVYYDVVSTQDNFEIEKDIEFISDSEIYETIDINWFDILRCDLFDGNGFRYYSLSETKDYNVQVGRKLSPWRYAGDIPKQPAECYIDGTVKITTQLGNIKALPIESNKFTIGVQ